MAEITMKDMYAKFKRFLKLKRSKITRADFYKLLHMLELRFENDDNKCNMTISPQSKIELEDERVFIYVGVDGGHFEDREILFVEYKADYENVDACYWCDGDNLKIIVPVLYNWIVGVQ